METIGQSLIDYLDKFATQAQLRGFQPPYAALVGIKPTVESVQTEHGEFRFYFDRFIPVRGNESTMYLFPMETYRSIRAQKAAFARWHK